MRRHGSGEIRHLSHFITSDSSSPLYAPRSSRIRIHFFPIRLCSVWLALCGGRIPCCD
uniref:Uncharacterized protein n=1 Tax=Arundo donax TaxID=35708 RepID=A0A0A9EBF3_ARUDO